MAKICMVSVQHSPLDDRIFYKEALSLQKAGFEICQVCAVNSDGYAFDIGGKTILNKNREEQLVFEGIPTKLISLPDSALAHLLNKVFLGSFSKQFVGAIRSFNADVLHAHEPISFYLAHWAAKGTKTKVIFDSHECWEDGTPKEKWIKKNFLSKLEFLITANQITRGSLLTMHPKVRSQVILNGAELQRFNDVKSSKMPVIVHDGYLPFNRGLKLMVEVLRLVKKYIPEIKLKVIGETFGEEKRFLQKAITKFGLEENILETGWMPYEKVPECFNGCAVGIITKLPTTNNVIGGPPIKYYNYTAAGLAVVDVDMPETTRLLNENNNGISVKTRKAEDIAAAIIHLFQNAKELDYYQQQSRIAAQKMNWEMEAEKLVNFYQREVLNNRAFIHRTVD